MEILPSVPEEDWERGEDAPAWELKSLKPMHKNVASLVAQGFKNVDVAKMVGITPEYVGMLLKQPLVKDYIREMNEVVGVQLSAMFEQSVEVIRETMQNGSHGNKLKAARLQLEATKRIGRADPHPGDGAGSVDRLERLAERLIGLQSNVKARRTFDENSQDITDVEV